MTLAEGMRVVLQALMLILLGRVLGVEGFGRFVAALATLQFVQPFAWRGAWIIPVQLIKQAGLAAGDAASRAMTTVFVGGLVATAIASITVKPLLLGDLAWMTFVCLCVSELVLSGICSTLEYVCLAQHQYRRLFMLKTVMGLVRAGVVSLILVFGVTVSDQNWAAIYLAIAIVVTASYWWICRTALGLRVSHRQLSRHELRDGFSYAVAGTASFAQDNLDKPIVLHFAGAAQAGFYGAAYRVITVALVPLRGLTQAAYPRFFELGKGGIAPAMDYANRLLPIALAYAIAAGAGMYLIAPYIGFVFGDGFAEASLVVQMLCVIPAVRVLSYLGGDALSGAGRQQLRSRFIIVTSVLNIVLNIALVPAFGWRGAAWATIIADSCLGLVSYGGGLLLVQRLRTTRSTVRQ